MRLPFSDVPYAWCAKNPFFWQIDIGGHAGPKACITESELPHLNASANFKDMTHRVVWIHAAVAICTGAVSQTESRQEDQRMAKIPTSAAVSASGSVLRAWQTRQDLSGGRVLRLYCKQAAALRALTSLFGHATGRAAAGFGEAGVVFCHVLRAEVRLSHFGSGAEGESGCVIGYSGFRAEESCGSGEFRSSRGKLAAVKGVKSKERCSERAQSRRFGKERSRF